MRGHPVFIAQHANATCYQACLREWHLIDNRRTLTEDEVGFVLELVMGLIEELGTLRQQANL
jgi:hypothetical protein